MTPWPETESTLVQRLGDPSDDDAWSRFDCLYRPVIYRYARSRGLQHSDAETLVSEVMSRVFRSAKRWSGQAVPIGEKDVPGGDLSNSDARPERFRAWLCRVAENALLNLVTRELSKRGTGGTSHQISLAGRPIPDDLAKATWDKQHRQHLFLAAAGKVQDKVDAKQWQIFWMTHVDGIPIRKVADDTGTSIGMIYSIRSRLLKRLREAVLQVERLEGIHRSKNRATDFPNGGSVR